MGAGLSMGKKKIGDPFGHATASAFAGLQVSQSGLHGIAGFVFTADAHGSVFQGGQMVKISK
jgi:hypothetical protein